jgi:hypothetical protein
MAVIQSGLGVATATVDGANASLRVNNRPIISATLGGYQCSLQSGVMAAGLAANAPVWSCRYTGANLCLIEKLILDGVGNAGTGFAAGVGQFRAFATRAYTVFDTLATAATLSGNNCKLRTSYATTGMGNIAIAATATGTHGTGANDAQPFGAVLNGFPVTAGAGIVEGTLYDAYGVGSPLILATNEGIEIQATVPATGTWTFGITVKWTEVTAAEWA